jgi:hypothetical protein
MAGFGTTLPRRRSVGESGPPGDKRLLMRMH